MSNCLNISSTINLINTSVDNGCGGKDINLSGKLSEDILDVKTFNNFIDLINSELIDVKNRQTISAYPTLRLIYDRYLSPINCYNNSNGFNYNSMDLLTQSIGTYWVDIIEQFVPSTTIWGSTFVYRNTIFDTPKHKYKSNNIWLCENPFSAKSKQQCGNGTIESNVEFSTPSSDCSKWNKHTIDTSGNVIVDSINNDFSDLQAIDDCDDFYSVVRQLKDYIAKKYNDNEPLIEGVDFVIEIKDCCNKAVTFKLENELLMFVQNLDNSLSMFWGVAVDDPDYQQWYNVSVCCACEYGECSGISGVAGDGVGLFDWYNRHVEDSFPPNYKFQPVIDGENESCTVIPDKIETYDDTFSNTCEVDVVKIPLKPDVIATGETTPFDTIDFFSCPTFEECECVWVMKKSCYSEFLGEIKEIDITSKIYCETNGVIYGDNILITHSKALDCNSSDNCNVADETWDSSTRVYTQIVKVVESSYIPITEEFEYSIEPYGVNTSNITFDITKLNTNTLKIEWFVPITTSNPIPISCDGYYTNKIKDNTQLFGYSDIWDVKPIINVKTKDGCVVTSSFVVTGGEWCLSDGLVTCELSGTSINYNAYI